MGQLGNTVPFGRLTAGTLDRCQPGPCSIWAKSIHGSDGSVVSNLQPSSFYLESVTEMVWKVLLQLCITFCCWSGGSYVYFVLYRQATEAAPWLIQFMFLLTSKQHVSYLLAQAPVPRSASAG
ncbi:hypothetical protein XENTR_v10004572 [Xenopus tropicalis]|nr:hypothetical protein XENTR_v10004572 [Xenopus tropicalis]